MVLLHRSTGNVKDVNKAYGTFIRTETGTDRRGTVLSVIGSGIGLGLHVVWTPLHNHTHAIFHRSLSVLKHEKPFLNSHYRILAAKGMCWQIIIMDCEREVTAQWMKHKYLPESWPLLWLCIVFLSLETWSWVFHAFASFWFTNFCNKVETFNTFHERSTLPSFN